MDRTTAKAAMTTVNPKQAESAPTQSTTSENQEVHARMSKRILIIDDDHDLLNGTSLRLRSAGYNAIPRESGLTGIRTAYEEDPDLIVLDLRMPGMGGIDVLRALKKSQVTNNIPVVVLSASVIDQKNALDAGAAFFVRKPYVGNKLVAVVDAALTGAASA